MRETDRVAIHEAMEQQTISIAKAGITTVLNSRVSVLAAANPIFGRYDDLKSIGDNIDLMSTILSRFDCIFIVRDVRDPARDRDIARHVLGVHISAAVADGGSSGVSTGGAGGSGVAGSDGEIDVATLKKFVAFCRDRCAPRLSEEAASILSSQYVHIRNEVRLSQASNPGEATVVPITVRQLEALIRISESLAKMRLSAEAGIADVEEALRLFKVSTLAASQSNPALLGNAASSEDVKRVEEFLRRRMGLRMTVNAKKIIEEALVLGHGDDVVKRAIAAMVVRGELMELNQHKLLRRLR
jgi:DNA replication licensing factor MCM5